MVNVLLSSAPHKARSEGERQQADEVYTQGTNLRVCSHILAAVQQISLLSPLSFQVLGNRALIRLSTSNFFPHALTASPTISGAGVAPILFLTLESIPHMLGLRTLALHQDMDSVATGTYRFNFCIAFISSNVW